MGEIGHRGRFADGGIRMVKLAEVTIGHRVTGSAVEHQVAEVLSDLLLVGRVIDDLHLQIDPGF
ncbi:hypothetical protein D3C86_1917540 [compost metagenome]